MSKRNCAVQGCENKAKQEYWAEIAIENLEGTVQLSICFECYSNISKGQPYTI